MGGGALVCRGFALRRFTRTCTERMFPMQLSQRLLQYSFLLVALSSVVAVADDTRTEEQKRTIFLAEYNRQRADKRLVAISILDNSREQRSIEMLYFVSFRDPDPGGRSRAFSALVHCEDVYGYTARLAAESFKREKEIGVKVEKAVGMGVLQYKWSALNELTQFLSTLRWSDWN